MQLKYECKTHPKIYITSLINVKESRNSPDVFQRVPGGLSYQIS